MRGRRTRRVLCCGAAAAALLACAAPADANPSPYGASAATFGATASADAVFNSSGPYVFNTTTGMIVGPGPTTIRDPNGDVNAAETNHGIGFKNHVGGNPGTSEFVFHDLSLGPAAGATITVSGPNLPNLAIVTRHSLSIAGPVDVTGDGAPGSATGSGVAGSGFGGGGAGSCSGSSSSAGGGGGFGGTGGAGGGVGGGAAGLAYGLGDQSVGLLAGSGGGGATTCPSDPGGAAGAAGGGGLALVSLGSLSIAASGSVSANGANGPTVTNQAGSGGGSGGSVLLMAPHLSLAGSVFARGGTGGSTSHAGWSGGGGGGGGRVTVVSDQPPGTVGSTAVLKGTGGSGGSGGSGGGLGSDGLVFERPFLDASGPGTGTACQPVTFSASPTVGSASYSWDFGDGTPAGPSATHTYTTGGTRNVTVVATMDDSGQTVSRQISIAVAPSAQSCPTAGGAQPGSGSPAGSGATPPTGNGAAPPQCVVPKLRGLSVAAARARLLAANCTLGKVKKPKARRGHKPPKKLVVAAQSRAAGTRLPRRAPVAITLAAAPKRKHHR